jgi:hypothetical protein
MWPVGLGCPYVYVFVYIRIRVYTLLNVASTIVAFVPANLDQNDVKKKWNQNKLAEK